MNVNELPTVKIDPDGGKFIMVEVEDSRKKEEIIIIRGNSIFDRHKDILEWFKTSELNDPCLEYYCSGGGEMFVYQKEKRVLIDGYSCDFGREPRGKTIAILQKHFPEYEVKATS